MWYHITISNDPQEMGASNRFFSAILLKNEAPTASLTIAGWLRATDKES
ncbi:MAG: hypothetical protein HXY23_07035 [Parvularculaceae bacterium]|jgi:hypothetical protein|nr:hypothetical protein [Parvularculaceae bacterium]